MTDHDAIQYSDQMQCAKCGKAWDANDPDPPECTPGPTTYMNNCIACGGLFQGDKHRRNCRQCAPRNPVVVSSGRAILAALKRDLQK